jgi:hypothetical protein
MVVLAVGRGVVETECVRGHGRRNLEDEFSEGGDSGEAERDAEVAEASGEAAVGHGLADRSPGEQPPVAASLGAGW